MSTVKSPRLRAGAFLVSAYCDRVNSEEPSESRRAWWALHETLGGLWLALLVLLLVGGCVAVDLWLSTGEWAPGGTEFGALPLRRSE
jgi:hypothetical protein